MPDAVIDQSTELRDTIAQTVCSFGAADGDACETLCVWCLANADTLMEVFHRFCERSELEAKVKR
jgi:hypothetical protein